MKKLKTTSRWTVGFECTALAFVIPTGRHPRLSERVGLTADEIENKPKPSIDH